MPKKPAAKLCADLSIRSCDSVRNTGNVFVRVKFYGRWSAVGPWKSKCTNIEQEAVLHPHRHAEVVQLLASKWREDFFAELIRPIVQESQLARAGSFLSCSEETVCQAARRAVTRCHPGVSMHFYVWGRRAYTSRSGTARRGGGGGADQ